MTTMTKPSRKLYDRYQRLREAGASMLVRREAYNDWFKARCDEGRPPDALSLYSADEAERFWARTVPGPDGHVYWTGGKEFRRNDGKSRRPQRWVWAVARGNPGQCDEIDNICGSDTCVNIEHLRIRPRAERRVRFGDDAIFGALRVLEMRSGQAPSMNQWDAANYPITARAVAARFGSWTDALAKVGMVPVDHHEIVEAETCARAIRELAKRLGKTPTRYDWETNHEWLRARGYPTAPNTIKRRIGPTFATAVRATLKKAA